MITYGGIDGTSSEEESYAKTYQNSSVNRLHRNELVPFVEPWYQRGPYNDGMDTDARARDCAKHVRNMYKSGKAKAIFLGGHSRGGAAVIEVAKWLAEEDIPVECLILFDAVDRSTKVGGPVWNTPIGSNVKRVIYAQRNPLACSRLSFGNCGFTRGPKTTFMHQKFFCTHSAVGGVPWTIASLPVTKYENPLGLIWEPYEPKCSHVTLSRDADGSNEVWGWARSHIAFAYKLCMERLNREAPVSGKPDFSVPSQPGAPRLGGTQPRFHIVARGDWLSKIALKYYGDAMKYPIIHKANLAVIGPNPDVIKEGQRLVIP